MSPPLTIAFVHDTFDSNLSSVHERSQSCRVFSRDMADLHSSNVLDLDGVPTSDNMTTQKTASRPFLTYHIGSRALVQAELLLLHQQALKIVEECLLMAMPYTSLLTTIVLQADGLSRQDTI